MKKLSKILCVIAVMFSFCIGMIFVGCGENNESPKLPDNPIETPSNPDDTDSSTPPQEKPDEPDQPTPPNETDPPTEPSEPDVPEKPVEPELPDESEKPETPEPPVEPDQPEPPVEPENPEEPEEPAPEEPSEEEKAILKVIDEIKIWLSDNSLIYVKAEELDCGVNDGEGYIKIKAEETEDFEVLEYYLLEEPPMLSGEFEITFITGEEAIIKIIKI